MDEAKQVAAGVAFDIVGRSTDWSGTGVKVEAVAPDGPAGRVLRPGDLIVRVNGTNVDSSVDASRIINQLPPGSTVRLGMQRAGVAVQSTLKTVAPREDGTGRRSEIGVELSTIGLRVRLPENVGIDSGNVVGPSAGLAFALYLIDSMSDDDLLRGRYVVATGSVSPDGLVLPVGRVKQKAVATQNAKRDLLLVPVANAKEARAAVADACSGNACVQVVPVHSVSEAVDLLKLDDAALAAKVGG